MGRKIITDNEGKWQLYSTNSDGVICECDSKAELAKAIAEEQIYDGKLKAIETLMTFPNGWTVDDKRLSQVANREAYDAYSNWYDTILRMDTYEEYYKAIDDKLTELMNKED